MDFTNILTNLSAIVVGLTALFFYFGKIIADTKVEKFERTDIIISGFFFTLVFILIPLVFDIIFYLKEWILIISPWIIILFHLLVMGLYSRYIPYKDLKKFELEREYNKRFDKKIEEIKKDKSILSKLIEQRPDVMKKSLSSLDRFFGFFEDGKVLLFISTAIFYSLIIAVNTVNVPLVITVAILSFVNLSLVAIAHGMSTAYYPQSKVVLIDGSSIEGKTIKFGEFICLIKKDKKYFVNKDQVKIIEQNIMKKNRL